MKKILSSLTVLACAYAAFGLEISPVLEGKMAAFSFTYDDGAYSHYTTALPLHLKYGMPAAPNAQNAVLAHTGDTIIAISPGVL